MKGIYIALSGAVAQERRLELISNNLANTNSVGYKADKLLFTTFLPITTTQVAERKILPDGTTSEDINPEVFDSAYVAVREQLTDYSQGAITLTGNNFDLAIEGKGFFVINTPEGERYTRCGEFTVNKDGDLVTSNGDNVMGTNGKITLPPNVDFNVLNDGTIRDGKAEITKLKLVDFDDYSKLEKSGETYFKQSDSPAQVKEPEDLKIRQGFIENSNVNAISNMVDMITTQRAYESYIKAITTYDDTTKKIIENASR